jgi:hypothetical protein
MGGEGTSQDKASERTTMDPNFTKRYKSRIKVYKPAGIGTSFISEEDEIEVLGQDIQTALHSAEEYLKFVITNSDWTYGEVQMVCYHAEVFIGKIPESGILYNGMCGIPAKQVPDKVFISVDESLRD